MWPRIEDSSASLLVKIIRSVVISEKNQSVSGLKCYD